ncbi:hypothetical protein L0U88_15325 [Flavihumibacter sp. RY-1]|uniref:Uncharacterized protein n=1 Tax=Flavihumibacter fluminis TaxID=2909236 RepID=A0ABS9BLE9_9BACT|nr:hypothetical protein [Flavihumibacter fluminis]MCF1716010.1 hypothetical protein [Flavihumibacter fluminis]
MEEETKEKGDGRREAGDKGGMEEDTKETGYRGNKGDRIQRRRENGNTEEWEKCTNWG